VGEKEGYLAVVEENTHEGNERAGHLRGHLVLPGVPGNPDIVVPDDGLLQVILAIHERLETVNQEGKKDVNRAWHQSTNQHPIRMGTAKSRSHGACGGGVSLGTA